MPLTTRDGGRRPGPHRTGRHRGQARTTRRGAVVVIVAIVVLGGACSDDEPAESTTTTTTTSTTAAAVPACAAEQEEPIDPNSARHVFPGAPEPAYTTDPPTSGPHQLGDHPTGALVQPIARPVQVGMLEAGAVLVQYRDPAIGVALARLAGGEVTVAPNPELTTPVVATAWLRKLTCDGPAIERLQEFVAEHAGKGAGH